jgi:hypothetical protein
MIEVLKQAAEDVSKAYDVLAFAHTERALELLAKTRTSLRQAIAGLESQEPVAWMFQHDETGRMNYVSNDGIHNPNMFLEMNPRYALVCPLYTHPPQRTWQGLTDEEIDTWNIVGHESLREFVRAIEAKLKEKIS